nr:MAG TPA: minor capsid protein [Bacteriophage sp.]
MVNLTKKEDELIKIYESVNTWAISDIVKRIMKNDVITETAKYRIYKLQEAGIHLLEIKKKIKSITKKSSNEIEKIFKESAIEDIQFSNKIIINNNNLFVSDLILDILNLNLRSTKNEFRNFDDRIVDSSYNTLINSMDKVHYSVISGMRSQSEVIKEIINDIGKTGLKIKNIYGRNESVESYVRRTIHTGVNKCVGEMNYQRAVENGFKYVLVSSHMGARHIENPNPEYLSHDLWQGKVFKLNEVHS